jgi:hypothetical protein
MEEGRMGIDWAALPGDLLIKYGGPTAFVLGVLCAAYAGLRHVAGKWLDSRFAQKLKAAEQAFEAQMKRIEREHDVLVRQLQSTIDRELERASKVHSREFEVLSEGWVMLYHAYWGTMGLVAVSQRVHSFEGMSDGQAEAFIEKTEALLPWAKEEIRALNTAKARNEYYWKKVKWWQFNQCRDARFECLRFIDRNAIFMRPDIRDLFYAADGLVQNALIEYEMNMQPSLNQAPDRGKAQKLAEGEAEVVKPLETKMRLS